MLESHLQLKIFQPRIEIVKIPLCESGITPKKYSKTILNKSNSSCGTIRDDAFVFLAGDESLINWLGKHK
jgi:hypothetical protein